MALHSMPPLLPLLLLFQFCASEKQKVEGHGSSSVSLKPGSNDSKTCSGVVTCTPGILLPVWGPQSPGLGEQALRAFVYFLCLMYMFLGVSIIADRFMAAVEVITSQEKEVTITKPNGETSVTTVRIWNETVSNLTLMALGSSAPEILLSVIEVCGHGFSAGELGPGTIVGSAAFNMFVIIGICVWVVPDGESRRIKHLRVFFITAFWSVFAYIWLYLILAVITPGIVQVWEALVTLLYFPVCVILAWIADRRLLFYKYMHKHYCAKKRHRTSKHQGVVLETEGELSNGTEIIQDAKFTSEDRAKATENMDVNHTCITMESIELDENHKEVIRILKELKRKHPEKNLEELIELANHQTLMPQQKSRAFYRIQATRRMIGAGNVLKKQNMEPAHRSPHTLDKSQEQDLSSCSCIMFEKGQYQCMENCGTVSLHVACQGGSGKNTIYLDYHTEDGSANAGSDYQFSEGTLIFRPGETKQEIKVEIIDDDVFEEEEYFFVKLLNLRVGNAEGIVETEGEGVVPKARLVEPLVATVTILDDDHGGIFTFGQPLLHVSESAGILEVAVLRNSGACGTVILPYYSEDGTAHGGGVDYEDVHGELVFANNQTCQNLQVRIIDDQEYEKQENFFIVLQEPRWLKKGITDSPSDVEDESCHTAEMGMPILGEFSRLEVIIEESLDFKILQGMSPNGILDQSTVDKLIKKTNLAQVIGTYSWREQFIEAVTVSAGDGDMEDPEEEEVQVPSCFDYVMHFLTVFWKILFACVPPTGYWNGWACFMVSIIVIGFLTAVIGDLASHFGCTVGLRDSVTAVVFVALGTSVPDTFASKVAAMQDKYADASVGNVTGSNAVNVFLGIGVAWSVAAVYWEVQGQSFHVDPGSLAFSVTLFTVFAFLSVGVLLLRRRPAIGGELGGPRTAKLLTTLLFLGLWLLYILFSSLEAYCHIQAF
ncbi:sodium/calcium exchanger 2a [Anguilla rostrata]|uniref:sodium/calcium exchanger 2a n=1 Tax=Anguilla rostrata TaxID=7938 RepID=UPI0030CFA3A4